MLHVTTTKSVFLKSPENGRGCNTQSTFLQITCARYSLEASQVSRNSIGSRCKIVFIFLKTGLHSNKIEYICSLYLKMLFSFMYDKYISENPKLFLPFFLISISQKERAKHFRPRSLNSFTLLESSLLECDDVSLGERFATFRMIVLPSSLGVKHLYFLFSSCLIKSPRLDSKLNQLNPVH